VVEDFLLEKNGKLVRKHMERLNMLSAMQTKVTLELIWIEVY
jgi:hypothetical protein